MEEHEARYIRERFGEGKWLNSRDLADTPFESLPILHHDGEVFAQSGTILRYVGKKCGLGGRNELEEAKVGMILDHIADGFESKTSFA